MTRKSLRRGITFVILLCCLFLLTGGILFVMDSNVFQTFRDFILLLVAIPAALLTDMFQKRNNFEAALRALWSQILISVNEARQYTYRENTTEDEYRKILVGLSRSVDEMRSVYKNIGESKTEIGYYPFESVKIMYKVFFDIGFGKLDRAKALAAREQLDHYWRNFKESFLWEFDRPEPESFNSPFARKDESRNNFKEYKKGESIN